MATRRFFSIIVISFLCNMAHAQTSPLVADSLYFVTGSSWAHYAVWAFPTITSNLTWLFPNSNGSSGNCLTTDGAGNLSWASPIYTGNGYIKNQTGVQTSANFNIDGNGNIGGTLDVAGSIQSNTIETSDVTGFL